MAIATTQRPIAIRAHNGLGMADKQAISTTPPATVEAPVVRDSDAAAYSVLTVMQDRLEELGVKVTSQCCAVSGVDVWEYTLHQEHGPFDTRGEAVAWALRNLVRVSKR